MRAATVALLLLLCLPAISRAEDWTWQDTARQAALTGVLAFDWAQTRYATRHRDRYSEFNPVLGAEPSMGLVDGYFAGMIIGTAIVNYLLPPDWRHGVQYSLIGVELVVTAHNASVGVKMEF